MDNIMKIKYILLSIFAAMLPVMPVWAGDIILGLNGRTKHEIVIPDSNKSETAKN